MWKFSVMSYIYNYTNYRKCHHINFYNTRCDVMVMCVYFFMCVTCACNECMPLCCSPLFLPSLSIHSRETYNALTNWLTDARTLASPNIVIVLVGNKKDLDNDREVTFMEASRFAQENGINEVYSYVCLYVL